MSVNQIPQRLSLAHIAAPIADGLQGCARCGAPLKDFRRGATFADGAFGCVYPDGAVIEIAMVIAPTGAIQHFQGMAFASPAAPCSAADVIDVLTYASYRAQREHSPHVTPERWKRLFPNVDAMEQRYQREVYERADSYLDRRAILEDVDPWLAESGVR